MAPTVTARKPVSRLVSSVSTRALIATLSIEAQERHERREKVYRDE